MFDRAGCVARFQLEAEKAGAADMLFIMFGVSDQDVGG